MLTCGVWEFVIEKVKNPWYYGDLEHIEVAIAVLLSLFLIPIDLVREELLNLKNRCNIQQLGERIYVSNNK